MEGSQERGCVCEGTAPAGAGAPAAETPLGARCRLLAHGPARKHRDFVPP